MKRNNVWIVSKVYPNLDAVNDDLLIFGIDVSEIVGVYGTEDAALAARYEIITQMKKAATECDCDLCDVEIKEWEVRS